MPKFSAYMRGGIGLAGKDGQPTLLDGIVSSTSELPKIIDVYRNYVYYVGTEPNNYKLYVYTTTEQTWTDLGYLKKDITIDEEIEVVGIEEGPSIESTTTYDGYNLKFKLPLPYIDTYTTTEIDNKLIYNAIDEALIWN